MRPHENLEVWKKSVDFVVAVYKSTDPFPREEKFGLTSQLRRAAVSISANIAEGAARKSPKRFLPLSIERARLCERGRDRASYRSSIGLSSRRQIQRPAKLCR